MTHSIPPEIRGEFSIYSKRLVVYTGINQYNISHLVPDEKWRLGYSDIEATNNPEISWKIRVELSEIATKFLQNLLKRKDVQILC